MKLNEVKKYAEALQNATVKCSCGCSTTITNKYHRAICRWCGNMVYLDKKEEFKNRMKEKLKEK